MEYKFENIKLLDMVKTLCAYKGTSMRKLLNKLSTEKGWNNCYPSFYYKLKNRTLKHIEMNDIALTLGYEIIYRDKTS